MLGGEHIHDLASSSSLIIKRMAFRVVSILGLGLGCCLFAHTGGIWDFESKDHTRFWTSMGGVRFLGFCNDCGGEGSYLFALSFSSIPSSAVVEISFVWMVESDWRGSKACRLVWLGFVHCCSHYCCCWIGGFDI